MSLKPIIRDPLTQLAERRILAFRAFELGASHIPYTIALVDLDKFTAINTLHGHRVGDHVIALTATCLSNELLLGNPIVRWRGDEFAVIFEDISIEKLQEEMKKTSVTLTQVLSRGGLPVTTVSIGISRNKATALRDHIFEADIALGEAKKQGGNKVVVFPLSSSPRCKD